MVVFSGIYIHLKWTSCIKHEIDLPWKAHRYWVEVLSDCLHPKTFLSSRLVNFAKSLTECNKSAVRFLASLCLEDKRTVLGKNLSDIAFEISSSVASMTPITVKDHLKYCSIPEDEAWRIPILKELLCSRVDGIDHFTNDDINSLVDCLCTR